MMLVKCLCNGNVWEPFVEKQAGWYRGPRVAGLTANSRRHALYKCRGCGLIHTLVADAKYDAAYYRNLARTKNGIDIEAITLTRANQMRRLNRGTRLLDVGAGCGHFAIAFAALGYQVDALDCQAAIDSIASRNKWWHIGLCTDWDKLIATGVRYDIVHLSHVLEHVADPTDLLDKCASVLKPNGVLWMQVPYERLLYRAYKLLGIDNDPGGYHLTLWNTELLRRALSKRYIVEAVFHDAPAAIARMTQCPWRARAFTRASCFVGYAPVITALARVK